MRKYRHPFLAFALVLAFPSPHLTAQAMLSQHSQGRILNRYFWAGDRGLRLEYPTGGRQPEWVSRELPFRFWHRLDFETAAAPAGEPPVAGEAPPEPRWVLRAPDGATWSTWNREPSAEAVREVIASQGWRGRLERLDDLVVQYPNLLEARLAAVAESGAQYVNQIPVTGQARMDEVLATRKADLEARLSWLHGLSGWPTLPLPSALPGMLGALGRMSEPCAPESSLLAALRQDLLEALRRDPDRMLLHLEGGLLDSLDAEALEVLVSSLELPPGTPLPPRLGRILPKALAKSGAWGRMESAADRALQQLDAAWSGKAPTEVRLPWEAAKLTAQLARGQVAHVRERIISQMGTDPDSANLAFLVLDLWRDAPEEGRRALETSAKAEFKTLGESIPNTVILRAVAAPLVPPRLRLSLGTLGKPAWSEAFQRLRNAPALDGWAPSELRLGEAPPEVAAAAKARLEGKPGWLLWSEREGLKASGTELPTAQALRDQLLAQGTPRLDTLSAFLRQNPDNLGARRERYQRVLERMPQPRLEVLLLEDAVALGLTPRKEGWAPCDLWPAAATRQHPRAEERLRAFPGDPEVWAGWLFWAAFTRPVDPAALAAGLSFVPADRGRWQGDLDPNVFRDVLKALDAAGRTREAGAWSRFAWERFFGPGLENARLAQSLRQDLESKQAWSRENAQRSLEVTLQPLAEALRRAGLKATLVELEATLKALKPGLEKLAQPKVR